MLMSDLHCLSLPNKVVACEIRRSRVMTLADSLGAFFDLINDLHKFDAVRFHGSLSRYEKAQIIDTLVSRSEVTSQLKLNVLCTASAAGNTGDDSIKV